MAKYEKQATGKYYGLGSAGYVQTARGSDGLAKSLENAGYRIGKAENLRIDRKKDKAIAKIDELYASGKSFETIQAEIIANKHPDLTGKYVEATTNYHAGRVKAMEVITNIEQNKDKYDITDETQTLDIFYKQYMPDTAAMDSSTLLGFTSQFNKFRAKDALLDADNRAAYATDKKVREGTTLLDGIDTENLKTELPDFIKSLQIQVPSKDGSSKPNLLYTNAETLAVVRRSVEDIIANAKTEEDLDRADALLNTNLGYGKNGSAIGTLASRKSKEVIKLQKALEIQRRRLITNDRAEAEYERKEKVKKIYAELYSDVEVEGTADGEVVTRPRTHAEKMALRDQLEEMGDVQAVANFDKSMKADLYIDTDPAIYDGFIEQIYNNDFFDEEEMKAAFNKLDVDPALMKDALGHFASAEKADNRKLHLTKEPFVKGTEMILEELDSKMPDEINPFQKTSTINKANKHIIREIYDFERDFFEKEGRRPDNFERADFMDKLQKYMVSKMKSSGVKFKTFDQQQKEKEDAELKAKQELEAAQAEEAKKEVTRQETGFYDTFNVAMSQLPNINLQVDKFDDKSITLNGEKVNFPQIEQHRTNNDNFPFNSISTEDFNNEEVIPFIQNVVTSIFPEGVLNKEFFDLIPQDRGIEMIDNLTKQLGLDRELVIQALEGLAQ